MGSITCQSTELKEIPKIMVQNGMSPKTSLKTLDQSHYAMLRYVNP